MSTKKIAHSLFATLVFLFIATIGAELIAQTDEIPAAVQAKYFQVHSFHDGRAAFHGKDCLWGYLDENYKEIIPASFDYAASFSAGLAKVDLKRGEAYIDESGNLLSVVARNVNYTSIGDYIILQSKDPERAVLYNVVNKKRLTDVNTYNQIIALTADFFVYRIGVRYGLMNHKGEAITPAIYHQIGDILNYQSRMPSRYNFQNNGALSYKSVYYNVRIDNQYGVIDSLGKVLIPIQYKELKVLENSSLFAVQDAKTEYWGILNAQNEIILPFRYSKASINLMVISEDLICILEEDNMVAYNHIGQRLKVYNKNAEIFSVADAIVLGQDGYRYLLNKQGQVISDAYFDLDPFGDSLLMLQLENRYGVCDKSGKIVLAANYRSLIKANYSYTNAVDVYLGKTEEGIQLIDGHGLVLLPDFFEESHMINDTILVLSNQKNKYLFDIKNKRVLLKGNWDQLKWVEYFNFIATQHGKTWTLVHPSDSSIQMECDSFYVSGHISEADPYTDMGLFIKRGDNYFGIEKDNHSLFSIDFVPTNIYNIEGETYFIHQKKYYNKLNLVRKSDKKEMFKTDCALILSTKKAAFVLESSEGGRGLVNLKGDTLIPFNYESLIVQDAYIEARKRDNELDYFDSNYKIIPLPEGYTWDKGYRKITMYDLIVVKKDGRFGCIDSKGKIIVPAEYKGIYFNYGGIIEAQKSLFPDFFNRNGEWIQCYRQKSARF